MKQFFLKIPTLTLSFLVLFSTFSFTVEKHYCGDFLMDISYLGDAEDCGMQMEVKAKKKNCCKDEVHNIEGQDELQKTSFDELDFEKEQFLLSYLIAYKELFHQLQKKQYVFKDFSPPDILKDYLVLYQTFLI